MSVSLLSEVVLNGHLAMAMWLRERFCPWDESVYAAALRGGRADTSLRWLREVGCPRDEE